MPHRAVADPATTLPAAVRPPLEVALARPAESVPLPGALPGGCQYEPKWDGFRLVVVRDGDRTSLWSRQGTDLTAGFPDLAAAAAAQLPPGLVLDGEAVVWRAGRLDFAALQARLTTRGSALERLARRTPAAFAAFDVLAVAGRDVRAHPLRVRRQLLEALAADWSGALQLTPASTARAQAEEWFDVLADLGVEGVVVKGLDQPYAGGRRAWLKVKHRDTIELVCAAVVGPMAAPEQLVLGLPDGATLPIVAHSTPLHGVAARRLGEQLRPPRGPSPWPAELPPSSFSGGREPVRLTPVEPIVVEVVADVAVTGRSFRHPVRFVRTRPELTPAQIEPLASAS